MPRRRYTEQQFRAAVADPAVRTIADLCRALGIVPRGGNYETVRAYAAELGVRLDHLGPPRSADGRFRAGWTSDDIVRALYCPGVVTFADLCTQLGLLAHSNNYKRLRQAAAQADIDLSHLRARPPGGGTSWRRPSWIDPRRITDAYERARSVAEMLRLLELPVTTSTRRWLHRESEGLGLDLRSLPGQAWSRGTTRPASRIPLERLLVAGRLVSSTHLRKRLIADGVKERQCESCGAHQWLGRPIPLELDHVNGDRQDNRLANLRLLCPNCHALTPTYRGRNKGHTSRWQGAPWGRAGTGETEGS